MVPRVAAHWEIGGSHLLDWSRSESVILYLKELEELRSFERSKELIESQTILVQGDMMGKWTIATSWTYSSENWAQGQSPAICNRPVNRPGVRLGHAGELESARSDERTRVSLLQILVISSVARISDTAGVKLGVVQLWQSIFIVVQCGEERCFGLRSVGRFAVGW